MLKKLHFTQRDDRKVYFGTDWHLGHDRDFIWGKRGFRSVKEHDDGIIDGINSRACANDVIIYCGDFSLNTSEEQFEAFLQRINCQNIYVLWGNHNSPSERVYRREVFNEYRHEGVEVYPFRYKNMIFVGNYLECIVDGQLVVNFHYPIQEFNEMKRGVWMVCGHSHYGNPLTLATNLDGKYLDVCWEGHGKLLSFAEVKEIMDKKAIARISHH